MGRSGSISIAEPNIFNQSSFVSRLFGYVEGEEIKRKLRASKSGIALTPELKITPTASKDTDDELLTMQSTIMNSDLYRLIIAENEKRMNNPSSPAMPEIDYTEMENIKGSDQTADTVTSFRNTAMC